MTPPLGSRQFSLSCLLGYMTLLCIGLGSVIAYRQLLADSATKTFAVNFIQVFLGYEGYLLLASTAGALTFELLFGRRARILGAAIGGCLALMGMCVVPLFLSGPLPKQH